MLNFHEKCKRILTVEIHFIPQRLEGGECLSVNQFPSACISLSYTLSFPGKKGIHAGIALKQPQLTEERTGSKTI